MGGACLLMKSGEATAAADLTGARLPETGETRRPGRQGTGAAGPFCSPFVPCFRCGLCCTKYHIHVNAAEARCVADRLGASWRAFVDQYWPGAGSLTLRQLGEACVLLERVTSSSESRCLIHLFKPPTCREWTPTLYRRECQRGIAKYWGLTVTPSGQVEGSEEGIRHS